MAVKPEVRGEGVVGVQPRIAREEYQHAARG